MPWVRPVQRWPLWTWIKTKPRLSPKSSLLKVSGVKHSKCRFARETLAVWGEIKKGSSQMQCGTSTQKVTMCLCDSDLKYKHLFNNNTENYELLNHLEALHHISSTRRAR